MPRPGVPVGSNPYSGTLTGARSLIRRERMRGRFTVEITGLDAAIQHISKLGDATLQELGRRIATVTVLVQREIQNAIRQKFTQRTGGFRKSWELRLVTRRAGGPSQLTGGVVYGLVGSNHPGAWIQNEGGTITSAVPMPVPLTEQAKRYKGGSKNFPGPLELTASGYLIERRQKETLLHYVLRHSVTLQGTHYLDQAAAFASREAERQGIKAVRVAVVGKY